MTDQEMKRRQKQYEDESISETIAWLGMIVIIILCLLANNI